MCYAFLMHIRKSKIKKYPGRRAVQIAESYWKDGKSHQRMILHVGTAKNEFELKEMVANAESMKKELERGVSPKFLSLKKKVKKKKKILVDISNFQEKSRHNEGILSVFGKLYDELGFNQIFGKNAKSNEVLKGCVLARLADPVSKYKTSRLLIDDFALQISVDKIYRTMDALALKTNQVKKVVKESSAKLQGEIDILLFDVTTLYFESVTEDDLKSFGFSKDCKFKDVQVVLALVTTTDGLPIAYQVFPGCTTESKTLKPIIEQLKKDFKINRVELAADRGLFSKENIEALGKEFDFIVSAKLRTMNKQMKEKILSVKRNSTKELEYNGHRLIIRHCDALAKKNKKDRHKLLLRLSKIIDHNGMTTTNKLIGNRGTKKYLKISSKKETASISMDKIAEDERWDGISGYMTNTKQEPLEVVRRYKRLWEIERSFRINKHDLKMRPIFHYRSMRVKAHLDICFLAYALAKQITIRYEKTHGEKKSFAQIRDELLQVESSIIGGHKMRIAIPSSINPIAQKIYQCVGVSRDNTPYQIS